MRQVKFRALELDSPSGINWVYGYYVAINGYYMTDGVPDLNQPVVRHYIFSDDGIKYEIAESTVGQFTGLTDKNGVEIYEGDIVKSDMGTIGLVEFINDMGWEGGGSCHSGFYCEQWLSHGDLDYHEGFHECEVIGNIHENPELLCAKK